MKFLLVIAVVVLAFYVWRHNRRADMRDEASQAKPPAAPAVGLPEDMVRCPVCAIHLPRGEAHAGKSGFFCSDEHRAQIDG